MHEVNKDCSDGLAVDDCLIPVMHHVNQRVSRGTTFQCSILVDIQLVLDSVQYPCANERFQYLA